MNDQVWSIDCCQARKEKSFLSIECEMSIKCKRIGNIHTHTCAHTNTYHEFCNKKP